MVRFRLARNPILDALSRSLALIEFDCMGRILRANENFCRLMGYTEAEIRGGHHSLFVEPEYARSAEYAMFWQKLGQGEFDAREYKRIGKGGREVWIQASYNPVFNHAGKVVKVVKVAMDVTEQKLATAEVDAKLAAVSRVQAVIEFSPDGKILTANDNFLRTLGYELAEIVGKHHRIFVSSSHADSPDYRDFWERLNRGEFVAAEFQRFGKGGREVWISASYNPVFDMNGRVVKVVKFATDVTARVNAVNHLGLGLKALAQGKLTEKIATVFEPALEPIRLDYNHALDRLASAMAQVHQSSQSMTSGAEEIAKASDELAKRTEQQAASLEETAAALEQITATVKTTADRTKQARSIVEGTRESAEKSGGVVVQAVEAMAQIEKSSAQITQIIGVIDEIAFQTNLLALNAGVEAARAGEAGRGFAVVASEVRALAQRSAEAAKEIKSLISAATSHVSSGVNLVSQTGQSLSGIVNAVKEISHVVIEIAASAQEQATGLEEVNAAVSQMDQITQRNAAMVEETTAASHSLNAEVQELQTQLAQFSIGTEQGGASHRGLSGRSERGRDLRAA